MADEVIVSVSLRLLREGVDIDLSQIGRMFDQAGRKYVRLEQNVGITEEAINKGDITTPGWLIAVNKDLTNFVSLRAATGAANFGRLDANYGPCMLKLGSGATAPFWIADTATCNVDYLLLEA